MSGRREHHQEEALLEKHLFVVNSLPPDSHVATYVSESRRRPPQDNVPEETSTRNTSRRHLGSVCCCSSSVREDGRSQLRHHPQLGFVSSEKHIPGKGWFTELSPPIRSDSSLGFQSAIRPQIKANCLITRLSISVLKEVSSHSLC